MVQTTHRRVDLSRLTPRTAPPRVMLSFTERNGPHVLAGRGGLLLLGPLGVNYFVERSDAQGLYLRRWDVRPAD